MKIEMYLSRTGGDFDPEAKFELVLSTNGGDTFYVVNITREEWYDLLLKHHVPTLH
jgi:hypothetical protein